MGQAWGEIARSLADSLLIPFRVQDYAQKLNELVKQLDTDFGTLMRNNGIQFGNLLSSIYGYQLSSLRGLVN